MAWSRPLLRSTLLTVMGRSRALSLFSIRVQKQQRHGLLLGPRRRLQLQHRAIATFVPRVLLRSLRFPIGLGAFGAGALAYLDHRVHQATDYTMGLFDKGREWAADAYAGVQERVDGVQVPDFSAFWEGVRERMDRVRGGRDDNRGGDAGDGGGGGGGGRAAAAAAAVAATTTTYMTDSSKKEPDQMLQLTLKMIEIRNILSRIGQGNNCILPAIVVIGSQSSGKSSVLEAIVGHEFLPKGSNMVTRRPIELTLLNDRGLPAAQATFPDIEENMNLKDFAEVQRILTELNLAVPKEEGVSDAPIRLTIQSPTIPNLSLIDLPGYIQLHSADQPEELDHRIQALCDKYIRGTQNVILAISAADVDLANSTSLRASRRVDPRGLRTIGVVTKMDLVSPAVGAQILMNNRYPLKMGYVGVVSKFPSRPLLAFVGGGGSSDMSTVIEKHENDYFRAHDEFKAQPKSLQLGIASLKGMLQTVLERSMSQALDGAGRSIRRDLDDTQYQFKVEYNDRSLTADTYIASMVDSLKSQFAELTTRFGKQELHRIIKDSLEYKAMDILSERYYTDESIASLSVTSLENTSKWTRRLNEATASLARIGVGKFTTDLAEQALVREIETILSRGNLKDSPMARTRIDEAVRDILDAKRGVCVDQVENSIKPYKWGVELEQREWDSARKSAAALLEKEIKICDAAYNQIQRMVGGKRRLQSVMSAVVAIDSSDADGHTASVYNRDLLEAGRRAQICKDRATLLHARKTFINSGNCSHVKNDYACPEIFLDAVAEKLSSMAVLFLNMELLSEFYYNVSARK